MYKEVRIVNINSVVEMNKLIHKAYSTSPFGILEGRPENHPIKKGYSFIWVNDVRIWLSTMEKGHVVQYNFRLDGVEQSPITAINIWKTFSKSYRTPRFHEDKESAPFTARPFMYYNPKFEKQRLDAIGYDLNSAYGNAVLHAVFPDTEHIVGTFMKVKKGQIGFTEMGKVVHEGGNASWIFPIMSQSKKQKIIDYFVHWWEEKKNAKDKIEKKKAKDHLNVVVGYWQKYNCFMRAAVVEYVNEYIQSIIKDRDDILFCNTDSIVSLNPIDGLKIGEDIGEWKIEHTGKVAYIGFNYQWNNEQPRYRGISSAWFKKDYDIITDGIPNSDNIYEFDWESVKIRRRK